MDRNRITKRAAFGTVFLDFTPFNMHKHRKAATRTSFSARLLSQTHTHITRSKGKAPFTSRSATPPKQRSLPNPSKELEVSPEQHIQDTEEDYTEIKLKNTGPEGLRELIEEYHQSWQDPKQSILPVSSVSLKVDKYTLAEVSYDLFELKQRYATCSLECK